MFNTCITSPLVDRYLAVWREENLAAWRAATLGPDEPERKPAHHGTPATHHVVASTVTRTSTPGVTA